MQSGMVANLNCSCRIIAKETNRIVSLNFCRNRAPPPALRWLCSTAEDSTGGSEAARKPQPQQKSKPEEDESSATHPIKPPNIPHSSPKLENTEINPGPNPILQQKRSRSSSTSSQPEATCTAGPSVDVDKDWIQSGSSEAAKDDKEYFSHNKPSPLSEIEVADTRKPITRATDGGGGGTDYGGGEWSKRVWMPEQLDTAEEAMERAMKIWTKNKMTGADPDAPHSRVLRELRGE